MLKRSARVVVGAAIGALTVAGSVAVAQAVHASDPSDWPLTSGQVAQARTALLLFATQSDPTIADSVGRRAGAWPTNVTSAIAFGTDRDAANAATGEAGAVANGGSQQVVCVQGVGQFSTAGQPSPKGARPQTYKYLVVCFDPSSGNVMDDGWSEAPINRTFSSAVTLDTVSPIAAAPSSAP